MGDLYKGFKEFRKQERQEIYVQTKPEAAIEALYPVEYHNNRMHMVVIVGKERLNFYPTTGRWLFKGQTHRGLESFLSLCKKLKQ